MIKFLRQFLKRIGLLKPKLANIPDDFGKKENYYGYKDTGWNRNIWNNRIRVKE